MRILVTGGRGQLGRSLVRCGRANGHEVVALGRDVLDVRVPDHIARHLDVVAPTLVISAAAYTAVDRAEAEPALAFAINAEGAGNVARACLARGIPLLHLSTDYVFDGTQAEPYREDAPVRPLGVYGASKARGEALVREAGGTVVRTSWLFGAGGPSFVHAILRRARHERVLRVVADQRGCPTWTDDLAQVLLQLGALPAREATYHACGAEPTTWHAFAQAIVDEAHRHRSLACERVEPITSADYPTAARRPASSVLDTSRLGALGLQLPSWRAGLARVVAEELSEELSEQLPEALPEALPEEREHG